MDNELLTLCNLLDGYSEKFEIVKAEKQEDGSWVLTVKKPAKKQEDKPEESK